ncbi:MAG TPA: DnaJ C-terminal domain-containing protein, partial [Actinomycetota bacterium]|nr:DnaJ C-terminal domain-containing protein [Actinomycetota bacterium]
IPAGIRDGARIRVRNQGGAAPTGERGDLFVVVQVDPHPRFGRSGDDITTTVPISFPDAALGALVTVETPLDGAVRLKVPAGTPSGKTFRVRGKGAPRSGGARGDLLVTVRIEVPQRLSSEERELVERLAELQATRDDDRPRTAQAVGA